MNHIRPNFRKLALAAGMLLLASIAVTPAMAAQATFSFTGAVTQIQRVDITGASIGGSQSFDGPAPFTNSSTLTGSYTFNIPNPNLGSPFLFANYNPITNLDLHLGNYNSNYSVPLNPNDTFIGVLNGFGPLPLDAYLVSIPLSGPNVNGIINPGQGLPGEQPAIFTPLDFGIDVVASGLFSSNSLPSVPPDLNIAANNGKNFRVSFEYANGAPGDRLVVSGTLSNLQLVATPLPPAVILFGAGLVALIGLGARNWRLKGSEIA